MLLKTKARKAKRSVIILTMRGTLFIGSRTVGIQTGHLEKNPLIISVAGGSSKAEAILAYMASAPKQTILVTDEGAANEMLKILINK